MALFQATCLFCVASGASIKQCFTGKPCLVVVVHWRDFKEICPENKEKKQLSFGFP